MAEFVMVPPQRLQAEVLQALLEEFASRDGTDYGERECTLEEKVEQLRMQLLRADLQLLYDADSEQWDLLPRAQAELLLNS
ncbi:MAG: YheU family protein [Halioglobus sp.]|nr:YheU family protein [Halioglobus sp.]